jgi:hypothetical protein
MFMKALVADQVRFVVVAGKKRKQRVVVPRAMVEDMVKGIQLIARRGAQGRNFKEFMRLWELAGKVFPLGPPDKNGASQPPRPPTFVRPTETASGTEELKASISPPTTPGTLIGPDGQEYVVARHHHAGQEDGLSE